MFSGKGVTGVTKNKNIDISTFVGFKKGYKRGHKRGYKTAKRQMFLKISTNETLMKF